MKWLWLFFLVSFTCGDLVVWEVASVLGLEELKSGVVAGLPAQLLVNGILSLLPTLAAVVIRSWLGALTGFSAGVIGVLGSAGTVALILQWPSPLPALVVIELGKLLGPMAFGLLPPFRRRALRCPPHGAPRGIGGCRVLTIDPGESLAAALARQPSALPRVAIADWDLEVPDRWDDAIARLDRRPRSISSSLALASFLRGKSAWGWWCLVAAFLALTDLKLALSAFPWPPWAVGASWTDMLDVVLALMGVGFLRAGVLRILAAWRVVRLLRLGEAHMAHPTPPIVPGRSRFVVTTIDEQDIGLAVETPRPIAAGGNVGRQGLLLRVNRQVPGRAAVGDVAAWDSLPHRPNVTTDGALSPVPARQLVVGLLGPLAVVVAAIILVTVLK